MSIVQETEAPVRKMDHLHVDKTAICGGKKEKKKKDMAFKM